VERVDLLIVGGGINGAGIARDAAGRGLSVLLCEQHDLAAHTSGASSKLIHGGLRYLEHGEFALVAKALAERSVLLRLAPHLIRPQRFVLLPQPGLRPAWQIRLGLFAYDYLGTLAGVGGHGAFAASHAIDLHRHPAGAVLGHPAGSAYEYGDATVDDARLVIANAVDAASRGAEILPRTRCVAAQRHGDHWQVRLQREGDASQLVSARALVNAAGPWAACLLGQIGQPAAPLRLVRGSHIVVPRLYEHDRAYVLQQPDRRIVFVIPWQRDYTLIGTTESDFTGDPASVAADDAEVDYLCAAVNAQFRQSITPADVVWRYSGVRPLLGGAGEATALSRDYRLQLDTAAAPLLNVWGGKLTTYRKLAEQAVNQLAPLLGCSKPAWTAHGDALPGGELGDPAHWLAEFCIAYPWLPDEVAARWVYSYGAWARCLIGDAASLADLGEHFGAGLHAREVDYLRRCEWATTVDDILWRRSKLGLTMPADGIARLQRYLARPQGSTLGHAVHHCD
jgi:glycerol-3-phosphate dehydrogenase